MKIAIDISPLESGHKVRGVGFYLLNLKNALTKYLPENEYVFFKNYKNIPDDIDILHYPYFDPFFLTLPAFRKYKTVVTVHDLTPLVFPAHFPAGLKGNIKWQIQKFRLKSVNGVIGDSKKSCDDIIKIAGVKSEKVFPVYLSAGEEFVRIKDKASRAKELREKYNLPTKFALYVGDVTWNKNVPNIMRAAINSNVPLVMVGKALAAENSNKSNAWNIDLVKSQELARQYQNIHRLGFIPTEDIVALYNMANVFVFPSLYEGFGLPILEAMQCGCPVITSREGSIPEVAGNAAYFVDAYSVDSVTNGLDEVFSNQKLQKELSDKGFQQAKKFSWKETATHTADVYRKIIGSS